jgi:hypothetical protein
MSTHLVIDRDRTHTRSAWLQSPFFTSEVLTLSTADFWDRSFFVVGALLCTVVGWLAASLANPLVATNSPPTPHKNISKYGQMSHRGQNYPLLKTTALEWSDVLGTRLANRKYHNSWSLELCGFMSSGTLSAYRSQPVFLLWRLQGEV